MVEINLLVQERAHLISAACGRATVSVPFYYEDKIQRSAITHQGQKIQSLNLQVKTPTVSSGHRVFLSTWH